MKQFGRVENGKLRLKDKIRFYNDLSKFEGKDIVIKIREVEVGRSIEQNALYWKWVDIISKELGYHQQEMNMLIKYKFLKRETINEHGYVTIDLKSTATLTKEEFSKLMNEVLFWANDTFNINLPSNE
jgi:hypothetical protein